MAEKAGFEPAVRYKRTLAFQASALNHSATSPTILNPSITKGGIDSNRLVPVLTPLGHASRVQNAVAFCRTRGTL